MAVRLDFLNGPVQLQTQERPDGEPPLFKDLLLDLQLGYTYSPELLKERQIKDLGCITDYAAVDQSLRNLFNTIPGQKILNPIYGLDLRIYLFEPVNKRVRLIIATQLLASVPFFEPRVVVELVDVISNPDDNQYEIILKYRVPTLEQKTREVKTLKANLNINGFTII